MFEIGEYVYFFNEAGMRVGRIINVSKSGITAWVKDLRDNRTYQRPIKSLQHIKRS